MWGKMPKYLKYIFTLITLIGTQAEAAQTIRLQCTSFFHPFNTNGPVITDGNRDAILKALGYAECTENLKFIKFIKDASTATADSVKGTCLYSLTRQRRQC
jgi:hypothetical protein